jgi:hypothetical protein
MKTERRKLSNEYLFSLWSRVVRLLNNDRCTLCNSNFKVDAHHFVHRNSCWALRWDVKNGIALCRECHRLADTLEFKERIKSKLDYEYLKNMEIKYRFKADFLTDIGMSEAEYRKVKAKELNELQKNKL